MRPSFDDVAMRIAKDVSERSTCPRLHTAAVICTPENRIIATGYNGSLPGQLHCDDPDVGCEMDSGHCIRTVHAETNAIAQAARYGIKIEGCTIYVLHRPCVLCAKLIVASGLSRVVYNEEYYDPHADSMLEKLTAAGILTKVYVAENIRG